MGRVSYVCCLLLAVSCLLVPGCKFNAAAKKFLGQSENYTKNAAGVGRFCRFWCIWCFSCWQLRLPPAMLQLSCLCSCDNYDLVFFFFSFALLSASRFAFFSILFLGFGQELVQLEPGLKLSKQKLCFVATVNMQRTKCSQTN